MSGRGPYAKGAAKREEILAAALDVVAKNGSRKASTREIAASVGLTAPGLMHYFGSREELYQEVLRARDERDIAAHYTPDPRFTGYLALIRHNTEVPGLVQLYAEFSAEASIAGHPAHEYFVERYAWVRGLLAGAIERAQEEGDMGPHLDVAEAADLLVAISDGVQVEWLHDRSIDMIGRLTRVWDLLRRSSWMG